MESREEIFLEEFNSELEFSIIDGGSIRANYGDITRLMQEYSDKQSKPLLEEIERLKADRKYWEDSFFKEQERADKHSNQTVLQILKDKL